MDQGVRERAEARLRALFDENPAACCAMLMRFGLCDDTTVKDVYTLIADMPEDRWRIGRSLALEAVSCRCPHCNLYPEPPIMGKHVGMG